MKFSEEGMSLNVKSSVPGIQYPETQFKLSFTLEYIKDYDALGEPVWERLTTKNEIDQVLKQLTFQLLWLLEHPDSTAPIVVAGEYHLTNKAQ